MRIPIAILLGFLFSCQSPKEPLYQLETRSLPANRSHGLPYLEKGLDGVLRCSWVETSGDTAILKYASWEEANWSEAEEIARGTNWFVNWADYPKISSSDQVMIAHYLQKSSPDTYAYDVMAKVKDTYGWGTPFKVHDDTSQTEHGFVSMAALPGDRFWLVWLDGRNTSQAHQGAMTLRSGIVNAHGQVSEATELDNRVCDCCATTITVAKGVPIAAYRDRSNTEIRDISLTRLTEEGWTSPTPVKRDNWEIAGCPVNGPSMDAYGNTVAVGWFTGSQNKPSVQLAFSRDKGTTFDDAILIDDQQPAGRVAVKMLDEQTAALLWLAKSGDSGQIRLRIVNVHGTTIQDLPIAFTSEARASGFPQLEVDGDFLYMANTQVGDDVMKVSTHRMRFR